MALVTRRSAVGGATALAATAVQAEPAASAATAEREWPEFREWYRLAMEEEELYNADLSITEFDARLEATQVQQRPLELAMAARQPECFTQLAILAVLTLKHADNLLSPAPGHRALEMGLNKNLRGGCPIASCSALENEAVLRLALNTGLLPGVKIHGLEAGYGAFRADSAWPLATGEA